MNSSISLKLQRCTKAKALIINSELLSWDLDIDVITCCNCRNLQ